MSAAPIVYRSATATSRTGTLPARLARDLPCYLFVLPAFLLYAIFTLWPMLRGTHLALYDWTGIGDNSTFVGLDNFREVAADPFFWNAFRNSFAYMLGVVPVQLFLALLVAVVLNNRRLRASTIYRTLLFLPVVTNTAIIGVIMGYMFSPLFGPVNAVLVGVGAIPRAVDWLATGQTALGAVILIAIWKNVGLHMVYWLAALQTVPEELYEAAKVDGANTWQLFRHVTVPTIFPVGVIIVVLALVGSLKVFDLIKAMTDGGPYFATETISLYIYRFAFSAETGAVRLGYATAAAVIFAVVTLAIALAQGIIVRRVRSWR